MVKSLKTKITMCLIINIGLLVILYLLPISDNGIELCIFKLIFNQECFNCGMTRAFLSIIHLDFEQAIQYNKNVIFVFPLLVTLYIITWTKIIFKKGEKNERNT